MTGNYEMMNKEPKYDEIKKYDNESIATLIKTIRTKANEGVSKKQEISVLGN